MIEINNNDLKKIQGGGVSWGVIAGIVAGITFIIGIIDGYTNPLKCNN